MVGPNARWAPEQLEQTKTPKSSEAPNLNMIYMLEQYSHNPHRIYLKAFQEWA